MSTPPLTPLLRAGASAAWFTSRGECTPADPYSGFNLCHYTGDSPAHIDECRRELARIFGIAPSRVVVPRQTHSTNVAVITEPDFDPAEIENTDALVTSLPDIIIGVNTADCVPVALIDPRAGINGIAHAGWRGAVGGIVRATVEAMVSLGSDPADITAAMGPSICAECFEVGSEVAARFSDDCVIVTPGEKPHVSLHKHILNELIKCGLHADSIARFDASLCTRCHPDCYWSARRMGINSGRIFTFVVKNRASDTPAADSI